jgi:hypothetical protein
MSSSTKFAGVPTSTVKALAKETAKKIPTKKQVKVVQEPVILCDGSTFKPLPVKSTSDVLRTSLLMLFKHVADIHVTVIEIVAEKFGISVEDLHKAITEDPRWADMFMHPLISDLTETATTNSVPAPTPAPSPSAPTKSTKPSIVLLDEPELVFE